MHTVINIQDYSTKNISDKGLKRTINSPLRIISHMLSGVLITPDQPRIFPFRCVNAEVIRSELVY